MLKYRSEIDGLRTIAVVPVILFHLGYGFLKGGFLGVDVFFVISGYLITKILTDDIQHGTFSIFKFWIRRIKRLLPLLITVVLVTLIIAPLLLFKPVIKELSQDIFPSIFSYFNVHALNDFGDYWGGKAEESFFLHTWSLSVEEQYYLFYAFFLIACFKGFKNFILPIGIIGIVSLGYFFFQTTWNHKFDQAFYLLPTRIWEFSIGGLAALIRFDHVKNSKWATHFPWLGLLLVSASYFIGSNSPWVFLLPVVGSAMVLIFTTSSDWIGKLLSTRLMVFLGKLSYSLYLWHWGVIVLFKNLPYPLREVNHHLVNGIILVLVFFLSMLSYYLIENKTRNYKHTPKIVLAGFGLIIGITLYYQSDLFSPYHPTKFNQQVNYTKFYDITPNLSESNKNLNKNSLGYRCSFPDRLDRFSRAYKEEGIVVHAELGTPKVMLIGDSHGVMWAKMLDEICQKNGTALSVYASNGSDPFFDVQDVNNQPENKYFSKPQRIQYAQSVLRNIDKWNPKVVVLVCRWSNNYYPSHPFLSMLEKKKIKVIILTQPPVINYMVNKNASQYLSYLGIAPNQQFQEIELDNRNVNKGNAKILSIASQYKNTIIFDVYRNMVNNGKSKVTYKNDVLYFDDDHLSYAGTAIHREELNSLITRLLKD